MSSQDVTPSGRPDPDSTVPATVPSAVTAAREPFAAEVLELDAVLALYAREASSSLGRRALMELAPREPAQATAALARIREAQERIGRKDEPNFAGLTDPKALLAEGLRGLDETRLSALRACLAASRGLVEWFGLRREEVPALAEIADLVPNLRPLEARLDDVLDWRGRVKPSASELLGRLDRIVSEMSERIDRAMKDVVARGDVRAVLSDMAIHRRGGRPVLAVKAKSAGRVRGLVHDRSQSGESVFIEPREVVELGNRMAEADADRRREVERILLELGREVLAQEDALMLLTETVAELELAWIGARVCVRMSAVAAIQPGEKGAARGLLIKRGRHPLLLAQVEAETLADVVPIDVRLGDDFDMLIITGPNTGGKTLALKTTGLFALLTALGLPVTGGEGTTVPLFDRVAADIGDEQEISQNLSTFASHLVRIERALRTATPHSLVLLDELGGGTDPDEGGALGTAVLEALLARGVPTLVSTHIGKLKEFAFRHARAENACTEFDLATLEPRYVLHVGSPGESGALIIARRLGLPEDVLQVAEQRTHRREGELAELMDDVRDARVQAEAVRNAAEGERDKAREVTRELETRREELERRSDQLEAEAQRGLEERVRDAARGVDRARALLPQLSNEAAQAMAAILNQLDQDLSGASLTERRQTFLDSLRKGSLVYLPRYRQRVLVHKLDREKREVVCKLGSMKVRVAYDEVTPYESL
tara:strand:- start:14460 stop:16607 length:2148 start_codon:yes stop_codon:yes gene_type:complete